MTRSRTRTHHRTLSLLLVPALPLAVSACDGNPAAPEPPAAAVQDSAAPAPQALDLNDPVVMNQQIMAGTRAFAEQRGIEALWDLVEPERVGNIQSVSEDRTRVLFLGATLDSRGVMIPSGDLWLADLATGQVASLGAKHKLSLHAGTLSPDGARIAAVGGERGHLYMSGTDRAELAMAVENDGSASISELTWNDAGDKLGFVVSPYVHLEDLRDSVSKSAPLDVPTVKLAWVPAGDETRTIDTVPVVADGVAHVPGLRWNRDTLELAMPAPIKDTGDVVSKGYCGGGLTRAGDYLGLKLPYGPGAAYMTGDDCDHVNRGDQLDFDMDGGPLHNGGAVRAIAAGRVISLRTDIADPSQYVCDNSYVSYDANYVVLQHFGAGNTAFTSLYWHLRRNPPVQVSYNQQVGQGAILGYNGCTGYAYGEHLHWGMRQGATFSYYGTEAVPEPIDGYSNLNAGSSYTSTNDGSGGTPPPGGSGNMLVREGAAYALNGYSPYDGRELTLWPTNPGDPEQRWDLLAPGSVGNAGWMIRRHGTNHCVNAANLYDYAPVNLWTCNAGDPDQQLDRIDHGASVLYRRRGTNYCLNAHETYDYGQVTLWPCNTGDIEQRWIIQ